jgi:hypothetical protein
LVLLAYKVFVGKPVGCNDVEDRQKVKGEGILGSFYILKGFLRSIERKACEVLVQRKQTVLVVVAIITMPPRNFTVSLMSSNEHFSCLRNN